MFRVREDQIIIANGYAWPIEILYLSERNKGFYLVFCAKREGEHPCICNWRQLMGTGLLQDEAIKNFIQKHFKEA